MSLLNPFQASEEQLTIMDGAVLGSVLDSLGANTVSAGSALAPGSMEQFTYGFSVEHANRLYQSSLIARKAVTVLPNQALPLFQGWTNIKGKDGKFERDAATWFKDNLYACILDACHMGRKIGDAYVILFFDDGQPMSEPLNPETITDFYGCLAKSRWQCTPYDGRAANDSQLFSVSYTVAEQETLTNHKQKQQSASQTIHRSRILHFPGLLLTSDIKEFNGGYNASIYAYLDGALNKWSAANESGLEMLQSHSAYIIGIKGLATAVAANNVGFLANRFRSLLQGLKSLKAAIIDSERETATIQNRQYSGIDQVIKQVDAILENQIDFPRSYLFNNGVSPYDASGLGDRYEMGRIIEEYYLTHLRGPLRYIYVLYCNWKSKADKAEDFELDIKSSLGLTREEEARIRFKNAQTDAIYLMPTNPIDPSSAVLGPDSVRTRWEGGQYSDELTYITPKASAVLSVNPSEKPAPQESSGTTNKAAAMITSKAGRSAYNGHETT
jgi:hypothetical protein